MYLLSIAHRPLNHRIAREMSRSVLQSNVTAEPCITALLDGTRTSVDVTPTHSSLVGLTKYAADTGDL